MSYKKTESIESSEYYLYKIISEESSWSAVIKKLSMQPNEYFEGYFLDNTISNSISNYYLSWLRRQKPDKEIINRSLNNVVHIRPFEPVQLNEKEFWETNPYNNRSWEWAHQNWSSIWVFVQGALLHDDRRCQEELFRKIRSWSHVALSYPSKREMIWHDHATALRLDRLIAIIVLLSSIYSREDMNLLKKLLVCHIAVLSMEDHYSKHTNHGFDQSLSLYSATHPTLVRNIERLHKIAYKRLISEINFAFTDEGVHKENSPDYHKGMMNNLVRAEKVLETLPFKGAVDYEEKVDINNLLNKALLFLSTVLQPDGRIPIIGDSENRSVSSTMPGFEHFGNYDKYVAAATNKQVDKNFPRLAIFPKSGYAIFRRNIDAGCFPSSDDIHIIFKCGFLSSYHRHDDDLNILLYAFGEHWLIDSGMWAYEEKDSRRIYMRSPLAHNIPVIPHLKPIRDPSKVDEYWGITSSRDELELQSVVGETGMYPGLRVRRQLSLDSENVISIEDFIDVDSKLDVSPLWLFHVPRDKSIVVEDNCVMIKGKRHNMKLYFNIDAEDRVTVNSGFNDNPPSIYSLMRNEVENSKVIQISSSHPVRERSFRLSFSR